MKARLSVIAVAAALAVVDAAATPKAQTGSVSGTALWRGKDIEGELENVVVTAIPVRGGAARRGERSFPETGTLTCEHGSHCPHGVTVATGDTLELVNQRPVAVSWNVVKDGRIRQRFTIAASQTDPPASADISALEPGAYELVDPDSGERRGWIYRAAADEIVVGPTSGNCRYAIELMPGTYRIAAWHPELAGVTKAVVIRARKAKRVDLVFSEKNR